jgi:hypothetical protein
VVAAFTGKAGVLSAASGHADPLVRLGLVGNPKARADHLGPLLADDDPDVRRGAVVRTLGFVADG